MFVGRTLLHGIYALCYLSRRPAGDCVSASAVAQAVGVPPEHARKILSSLAGAGLVTSVRGRAGGYALGRRLQDITVLDVRDAVQPEATVMVKGVGTCPVAADGACSVEAGLTALRDDVRALLAGRTLAQVVGEECRATSRHLPRSAQRALAGV